jgi:hypothetical protein
VTPFERVLTRCQELVPSMAVSPGKTMQAVRLIQEWIDAGCDADLDILPAINGAFAKMKGSPTTAAYFNNAVLAAKEKRCGSAEAERRKAERIAWLRTNYPMRYECDVQVRGWMEKYEQQHGEVGG